MGETDAENGAEGTETSYCKCHLLEPQGSYGQICTMDFLENIDEKAVDGIRKKKTKNDLPGSKGEGP